MGFIDGLKTGFQSLVGHKMVPAYPSHGSGQGYRPVPRTSSWNLANLVDLAASYRDAEPQDLVRFARRPHPMLVTQSSWRKAEYFQGLSRKLEEVTPEAVGLERLLDARMVAARKSTVDGPVAQMRAVRGVVAGVRSLAASANDKEGWKTRKQARQYIAREIGQEAQSAALRGDNAVALEAFRAIEDTGAMNGRQLRTYGEILRNSDAAADPASLRIYLECLEQHQWQTARDRQLESFQSQLTEHLSINERTPRHDVAKRMALLARMQAGGGALNVPAKSLGLGYLLLEQPERAVPYLQQASEMDGHDGGETFFFLAQSLFRTDQWDKASEAFSRAIQLGFERSRIAAWQGLALARSGQWSAAYEVFRLAEQNLGPEADAAFFVYWGLACFRMGAVDEARTRFQQAIAKSPAKDARKPGPLPDRVRAQFGLAVCLAHEGEQDAAIALLEKTLDMKQKFAPASHLLGRLLEQKGDRARALRCYRAAVEANPGDLVYVLSLGLALDDDGKPEALQFLNKVMDGGQGSPEVMRRLALGYRKTNQHKNARAWFRKLAEALPGNGDYTRWDARYCATEAAECFNRGDFAQAIRLWEQVHGIWPEDTVEKLGIALLCDASERLKKEWNRSLDCVWPQIARAHQLAPSWNSRYLNALSLLVRGDYAGSGVEFAALGEGAEARPEVRFFAMLARYLGGDDAAINEFNSFETLPGLQGLNAMVGLLQIQAAARNENFKLAAERVEEWLKLPDCLQAAAANRSEVNALIWMCLKRAELRVTKISKIVLSMKAQSETFWMPAIAAASSLEPRKRRAGEGEPPALELCDRQLLTALDSLPEQERDALQAELAEFLRYRIEDAVYRGDLVLAADLLDRLVHLPGVDLKATGRLESVIQRRLHFPSHEKAYALIHSDPESARATWLERLKMFPGEHDSLEHLAALAWTRAYDRGQAADQSRNRAEGMKDGNAERKQLEQETARDYEAAISYFVEGLGHFQQLYEDPRYWDALRTKGRLLATAKDPFDEAEFDKWRGSALRDHAKALVDFATHAAHHDKSGGTARAKSALARLRNCGLPREMAEGLAASFAKSMMDSDPTALASGQFEQAMARAERVLLMDPDNPEAMDFLVRGHTYRAQQSKNETPTIAADRIGSVRARATRLEELMPNMNQAQRARVIRNLAVYWEETGKKTLAKTGESIDALNRAPGFPCYLVREVRKGLEQAAQDLENAVRLDSVIGLRNRELTQNLQKNLGDIKEIERKNC
jgi:tetratricopeptide (TPR) repeat protein